jgi:C4-dicarboxylate transporter DctM subunit
LSAAIFTFAGGLIDMVKTILDWIEKILFLIGTIMIMAISAVIVLQIICRYFFNQPLTWPEEVGQFLLIASVFLGVGVVEKADAHIRAGLVFGMVSKKTEIWLIVFGKVLSIFVIVGILLGESSLLERVKILLTPAAQIPRLWLHVIILSGIVCWLVYLAATSVSLLISLSKSSDATR